MATIEGAEIAAEARRILDAHPATWTSYAELCSAHGLSRGLALVVARAMAPEPTGGHWFRIRNEAGVYNVPVNEHDRVSYGQAEADRLLRSIGVTVIGGRADPGRKIVWTSEGWVLARGRSGRIAR
jgi:hypothetical protein